MYEKALTKNMALKKKQQKKKKSETERWRKLVNAKANKNKIGCKKVFKLME